MKTINVIIERGVDVYAAYAENIPGIYATGESVEEVKRLLLKSIDLYKKYNSESTPSILLSKYKIEYTFDIESFFNYYKGIFTKSGLEKLTGINQKQIQHYTSGLKKPRIEQRRKIENALHKLGIELQAVKF
jgi:predicted RNase H-like HicB family nuclease